MSQNRSLGSNYHQGSQSRKMSIGVVVDSCAKMKDKHVKGVRADLQTSENATSTKDIPTENEQKRKEFMTPNLGRQDKAPCQETSPWVCTKTFSRKKSNSDAINQPKRVSNLPSTSNVQYSGRKIAGDGQSVKFFADQMSNLPPGDANEKKFKKQTYQSKKSTDGTMGRKEESSHATAEKIEPTKRLVEQGTSERGNNGQESLRMKLQELLGTVSSPNKQNNNSETRETDENKLKPKSKTSKKDSPVATHRQQLDTIETDSGSLDHTIKRAVTRSLTRKKPQAQKLAAAKQAPSCQYKQVRQEENELSFVEAWSRRVSAAVNRVSTKNKSEKSEIKTSGTEALITGFAEGSNKDEIQQATDKRKTKAVAENTSLLKNKTGGLINFHCKNSEMVEPKNTMKETSPHQFKVTMIRDQPGDNNEPVYSNGDNQEPCAKPSVTKNAGSKGNLESPTFEIKTTSTISAPRSLFQTNPEDHDVDSSDQRSSNTKGISRFDTSGISKGGYYNTNLKNLAMDIGDSPVIKSTSLMKKGQKDNRRFPSLREQVHSQCSADNSPVTVPIVRENLKENRYSRSPCEEVDSESSEDGSPIKAKRQRIQKGAEIVESSPDTASQNRHTFSADGDHNEFLEPSEQDGLAGAVTLFALALKRIKSKIHSTTVKHAAEILLSLSKNIHRQLQNAETQIQTDVGKLTTLGKSKRKRLENQCQEQQEQLKRIYEKFKEEIDQHLQNCSSTFENLEAHHIEVRATLDKQRLSHKKLLMQTEEAMEIQLNDAQRRLDNVHKLSREKMLQLKQGIGECLKEGILD